MLPNCSLSNTNDAAALPLFEPGAKLFGPGAKTLMCFLVASRTTRIRAPQARNY